MRSCQVRGARLGIALSALAARRWQIPPNQRRRFDKVSAVSHQVPVPGEAPQLLHGRNIEQLRVKYFVRRMRIIDHLPRSVVAGNRRAAQPLQDADLDFVWLQANQAIESRAETFAPCP